MRITKLWTGLPEHIATPDPFWFHREDNYVVLDFETTTIENGDPVIPENRILCACWERGKGHPAGTGKQAVRGGIYEMGELVRDIEQARFIVAHNAKFELGWLKRCGLDLTQVVVWCTQTAEYVIAGNRPWLFSLEECAKRRKIGYKDFVGKLIRQGVDTESIPYSWLEEYCHKDVEMTQKLFWSQRKDIYQRKLEAVNWTRQLRCAPLADIESNGMCLDADRVSKLYFDWLNRYNQVEAELNEITGGINFKSSDQVAEYVYGKLKFKELKDKKGNFIRNKESKRWPTGKPKTDKATMEEVLKQATTDEQRKFVTLRQEAAKLGHALSNALSKFQQCCTETEDNILYAKFRLTRTATHRLSSTGVRYSAQFQNFDRRFKPLFKARTPGWSFTEHDQAQLEWKVAVALGQDRRGLEDIENKVDAHAQSASHIFSERWEDVGEKPEDPERDAIRTAAKAFTFKPLFGGEFGSESEMRYYRWFRETYTGIVDAQERWKNHVANYKHVRAASGLIFYWPHAKLNKWGSLPPRIIHQICNYNIQSFATADIVPISLVYMWHRLKQQQLESFIVSTVHDSVLGEVKPEEKEEYDTIAKIAFEHDTIKYLKKVYKYNFEVPLVAEGDWGTHWHTTKHWEEEYLSDDKQTGTG